MYDFHSLMDFYEFQCLACDVLKIRDKKKYYVGTKGRDEGIDIYSADNKVIGQVKNFKNNFSQLKTSLLDEVERVKKLKPEKYILVVSNDLSNNNCNILIEMFKPYLKREDILDKKALNDLLSEKVYESLVLKYIKLLVPNTFVLSHYLDLVVHKEIYTETNIVLNKMKNEEKIFVLLNSFVNALEEFRNKRTIIITGEPGVGKSVLARRLVTYLLNEYSDIEFYAVKSIQELFKVFKSEKKQVYLFDDFWGDIKYNFKIGYEEKRQLIDFMNNMKNFQDKYLIMTSREYIFEEGLEKYHSEKNIFKKYEFGLKIEDFKALEKFEILSSHLEYNCNNYIICKNILKFWKQIINHDNYTPRLIETFFRDVYKEDNDNIEYDLLYYLDQPYDYWTTIILNQEDVIKYILFLIVFNDSEIELEKLQINLYTFLQVNNLENLYTENFWNEKISMLEDSFVLSEIVDDKLILKLKNPSYKNFLLYYFSNNYLLYTPLFINYLDNAYPLTLLYVMFYDIKCNYKELKEKLEDKLILALKKSSNKVVIMSEILNIEGLNNSKVVDYIYSFYKSIINDLDDYLYFNEEGNNFIYFIKNLNNIISLKEDATTIIDEYLSYISEGYIDEVLSWVELKDLFLEEFNDYVKTYRDYVKDIVENCVRAEAYYYLENNDTSIGMLYDDVIDLYEEINITCPVKLKRFLDEITEEIFQKNKNEKEKSFKINEEQQLLLDEEREIDIKIKNMIGEDGLVPKYDLKKYLKNNFGLTKEEIKIIQKIDNELKIDLMINKPSLKLLIDFLKDKDFKYDLDEEKLLDDLINYIFDCSKIYNDNRIIVFGLAYKLIDKNVSYFKKEEVLEWFKDIYEEDVIESLLESNFLRKKGKWYCFINFWVFFHLILTWYKKHLNFLDINILFNKLLDYKFEWYNSYEYVSNYMFLKMIKKYCKDKWKEILKDIFLDFEENIDKDEDIIIKSLLECFSISVYKTNFDDYYVNGSLFVDVVDVELDINILDFIYYLDNFSFLNKYLNSSNELSFNDYLDNKSFYNYVKKIGLGQKCLEIYEKLIKKK